MAYRIAPFSISLSDSQDHSLSCCKLFQVWFFSYSCAAVDKISTDIESFAWSPCNSWVTCGIMMWTDAANFKIWKVIKFALSRWRGHIRSWDHSRCWLNAVEWYPVYTIQPVVIQPVWQPGKCLYTRYNRLSNPLYLHFPRYCIWKRLHKLKQSNRR